MSEVKRFTWLTAAVLGAASVLAPASARAADLDYGRTIREESMVFVPYRGMDRGPIYYTSFEQRLVGVSRGSGPLRRIVIEIVPTAHVRGQYNAFVAAHHIQDARISPTANNPTACRPTAEIESLLGQMPQGARPTILGPNYPQVCSLAISVLAEDVDDYLALIADRPVITLDADVPFCQPDSPFLHLPDVVDALVVDGALSRQPDGAYAGDMWDVLYSATRLTTSSPALFGPAPETGWKAFMKKLTLDVPGQRATLSASAAMEDVLVCLGEPLHLQYPPAP